LLQEFKRGAVIRLHDEDEPSVNPKSASHKRPASAPSAAPEVCEQRDTKKRSKNSDADKSFAVYSFLEVTV
jgi:hypothetical protein